VGAIVGGMMSGCAGGPEALDRTVPFTDGTFTGTSGKDDEGAIGQVTVTVRGGDVAEVSFDVVQPDGRPKDEDYGKDSSGEIANTEYYAKAQQAVEAFDVYAARLIEVGYPDEVDVISGATWAHRQFVEASTQALAESQGESAPGAPPEDIPDLPEPTS
jgi:major membrane immunogen (membrane-anchored lipoprotein)